jgi:hypothetical protein
MRSASTRACLQQAPGVAAHLVSGVLRSRWTLAPAVVALLLLVSCSSDSSDDAETTTTSDATTTTAGPAYTAEVVDEVEVDPSYRQGLARTEDGWIFSVNDGLFSTDDALKQSTKLAPAIPDEWKARGFNHIGDIDVVDGVLYAPLEQPNYELGTQAMLTYDAVTLEYKSGLDVKQHHNSFVTVEAGIAYSMDYFGGEALLRYDIEDNWRVLEPIKMSMLVENVQGADLHDGAAWLSTDDATEGVYRVDLDTGKVDVLGSIGYVDGEGEGIDATPLPAGDLHVLSIDANIATVRLIELKVSAA